MKRTKKTIILLFLTLLTMVVIIFFWHRTTPQYRARHLVLKLRSSGDPPNLIEKTLSKFGSRYNIFLPADDSRLEIIYAIIELGPAAVPALVEALHDQDQTLIQDALSCLNTIKSPSLEAQTILFELIKDENFNIKNNAAYALIVTATDIYQTIPFILRSFSTAENSARHFLTFAMAERCIENPQVISELLNLLQDDDINVRIFTLMLLKEIGPNARQAVPHLRDLLDEQDFSVRFESAAALLNIDPTSATPQIIEILIEALNNEFYQTVSIMLLGEIGPPAQKSVPLLRQALEDPDWHPRHEAALSLVLIDPNNSPDLAVNILIDDLRGPDNWDKIAAMRTLAQIGPIASKAVPMLHNSLIDEFGRLNCDAAVALWKIDPVVSGPQVMDLILTKIDRCAPNEYHDYLYMLQRIGLPAQKTIPILLEKLDHLDTEMKSLTISTLGDITPPNSEAVSALKKALKDKKAMVRNAAREALKNIHK